MMAAPAEANSKNSSNKDTDLKSLDASKQDQDDLLDDSLMFSDDFQDDDLINMGNTNSNVLTTEKDPVVAKQSPTASSNPEAEQITLLQLRLQLPYKMNVILVKRAFLIPNTRHNPLGTPLIRLRPSMFQRVC